MATVVTNSVAAAPFNGMSAVIVQEVAVGDPSYSADRDQVIVQIGDLRIYLYADEVVEN